MVLPVKFHLNQQQSLILSVLMAPKNKEIWSSSVSAAPEPGQAQPQAHFGCQEWLNQVSPALLLVAKLINTDTDLDPAAQKLLIFPPTVVATSPWMGNELFSRWEFTKDSCRNPGLGFRAGLRLQKWQDPSISLGNNPAVSFQVEVPVLLVLASKGSLGSWELSGK